MDTPYDDVFHQKVASDANSEVILFTKKFKSTTDLKNPLAFLKQNSMSGINMFHNESEDKEPIEQNDNPRTSKSSPNYVIEFNADNKLEMVPKSAKYDKLVDKITSNNCKKII